MGLFVKVKTGAKKEDIKEVQSKEVRTGYYFLVSVKERPIHGKANEAVAKKLAEHFGVSAQRVRIISGTSAKWKIFEIADIKK